MRLNRGTIFLIGVLVIIIAIVLVISNQQASAPGTTPTPNAVAGPLLPGVAGENIVRYEVRDNTTGDFVVLTKDTSGTWLLDATNAIADRTPDQSLINTTVGQIAAINYSNLFQDDQLATFGLDHPLYTVFVTTSDNLFHVIYIGSKSPTSARYYAVVQQTTLAESTDEATTEPGTFDVQPGEAVATEFIGGENPNEEGVMPPSTSEATAAVSSKRIAQAAQATEEPQAVATEQLAGENPNGSGVMPEGTALVEGTVEATIEPTAEATAEATEAVIESPGVTLEGQQTIYLIPQTVIDTLKNWLTTPPYMPLPTAAPTVEVTAEATAAASPTPPLLEAAPTQEATAEATAAS